MNRFIVIALAISYSAFFYELYNIHVFTTNLNNEIQVKCDEISSNILSTFFFSCPETLTPFDIFIEFLNNSFSILFVVFSMSFISLLNLLVNPFCICRIR